MSANIIPINNEVHANLKVKNDVNLDLVKDQQIIPVVVHEFAIASANYPVVFVKNTETDQFQPVALMGLAQGENLFLKEGEWLATHMPGVVQNYPFRLVAADEEQSQLMMALDHSSDMVDADDGEALFEADGKETPFLEVRKKAVIQYFESGHVTDSFTEQLVEFGLLIERSLSVAIDGKETNMDGIYYIDEQKLNEMSDEDFNTLRKRGFLSLIYAQLGSLNQVQRLIRLKTEKEKVA